jgi:hypothetical protein
MPARVFEAEPGIREKEIISLRGRTILVYAEDSPENTLPYLKYVVSLSDRAGRVILACSPELLGKLSAAPGVYATVRLGDSLPDHDAYVPLLTLPWLLEKCRAAAPR